MKALTKPHKIISALVLIDQLSKSDQTIFVPNIQYVDVKEKGEK
jgi:hypothetical protein